MATFIMVTVVIVTTYGWTDENPNDLQFVLYRCQMPNKSALTYSGGATRPAPRIGFGTRPHVQLLDSFAGEDVMMMMMMTVILICNENDSDDDDDN